MLGRGDGCQQGVTVCGHLPMFVEDVRPSLNSQLYAVPVGVADLGEDRHAVLRIRSSRRSLSARIGPALAIADNWARSSS
jgi:hypothetical protein